MFTSSEEFAEEEEEFIGTASLIILFVFLTENMCLFIAFGAIQFCQTPGFVLDFVVITTSISCALFLENTNSVTLLMLLRLWRIARIIHGFYLLNEKEDKETKARFGAMLKDKDDLLIQFEKHLPTEDRDEFEMLMRVTYKSIEATRTEAEEAELPSGQALYKYQLLEAIEASKFQMFTCGLLFIDMACVIISILTEHNWRIMFSTEEDAEGTMEVLEALSIGILSFFQVEVCTVMWALGPRVFCMSPGEMLDLIVVTVSLACDLAEATGLMSLEGATSLLLVMRLWRIGRLLHGLYMINYKQNLITENDFKQKLEDKTKLIREVEQLAGVLESALQKPKKNQ